MTFWVTFWAIFGPFFMIAVYVALEAVYSGIHFTLTLVGDFLGQFLNHFSILLNCHPEGDQRGHPVPVVPDGLPGHADRRRRHRPRAQLLHLHLHADPAVRRRPRLPRDGLPHDPGQQHRHNLDRHAGLAGRRAGPPRALRAGKRSAVPSLILIHASVLQFSATVEIPEKPFHLNLNFNV